MQVFMTELVNGYAVGRPFVRFIRAASAAEAAWAARGYMTRGGYKDTLVDNELGSPQCTVVVSEADGTHTRQWTVHENLDGSGKSWCGLHAVCAEFDAPAGVLKKYDVCLHSQPDAEDPNAKLWSSVRSVVVGSAAMSVAGILADSYYGPLENAYVQECLVDVYESGTRAGGQTWEVYSVDNTLAARIYRPKHTRETPMTETGQPSAGGKGRQVSSAVSSSNGACIAYADAHNNLCFRDRHNGTIRITNVDLGKCPELVFSGDGQHVASLSFDRLMVVTVKGKVEFNQKVHVTPIAVVTNWDATRVAAMVGTGVYLYSLSGELLAKMHLDKDSRMFSMKFYDADAVAILALNKKGVPTEFHLKPDPKPEKQKAEIPVKEGDTVAPFAEVVCGAGVATTHRVYFDESNGIAVFSPQGVFGPIVLTNPKTRKTLKLDCLPAEIAWSGSFIRGTNTFAATVGSNDKPYERIVRYWEIPQSFFG